MKSSRSSRKTKGRRLDRPFDPAVLRKARQIVSGYHLIVDPRPGLGYLGTSIELRGVLADGKTPGACVRATLEAQAGMVATMLEQGERPPMAVDASKRAAQINIRVTSDEKLVLEHAAQRQGFRNVSEFLRTTALRAIDAA